MPSPVSLPARPERPSRRRHILVAGGSSKPLDLPRIAISRSEDVILASACWDETVRRFVGLFAIEARARGALVSDVRLIDLFEQRPSTPLAA